ncbi:MAG: response regulator transcription factor [Dorea sp.]|jgi:DNA-binding LytR/AlgR family response regulator|nr:response regulator transcription factor [Dorea sp.]MCI9613974.1 response regulator transcription factor [Dorea sp.]
MIYIAICDDDKESVSILKDRVTLLLKNNSIIADISVYTKSQVLKYDIEEKKYFDLILSDIEMPELDGMVLAGHIKSYLPDVLIVFITGYLKYAVDAFELSVFRYIPKNLLDIKFDHAVLDAIKIIQKRSDRVYYILTPSRSEKILHQRILYIEREGKNSILTLTDGSNTKVRKSLSTVMKELNSDDFIYIDRGTIVNIQYVMKVRKENIELKNGVRLFASHAKIEQIKKMIDHFWGERIWR